MKTEKIITTEERAALKSEINSLSGAIQIAISFLSKKQQIRIAVGLDGVRSSKELRSIILKHTTTYCKYASAAGVIATPKYVQVNGVNVKVGFVEKCTFSAMYVVDCVNRAVKGTLPKVVDILSETDVELKKDELIKHSIDLDKLEKIVNDIKTTPKK